MDKNEDQPEQHITQTKSRNKKKWLMILLIILLILAIGLAYWWCNSKHEKIEKQKDDQISQLQQEKQALEKQLADEKAKAEANKTDETACTSPSADTIDNVKASITSGNTAALEGYMASKVTVIIAASEGLGERTPAQAVGDITSFISGTSSWDFNLASSTISSYSSGFYSQYFPEGGVVGKANNSKVISFSFDCNGKIKTVFLAASSDLL